MGDSHAVQTLCCATCTQCATSGGTWTTLSDGSSACLHDDCTNAAGTWIFDPASGTYACICDSGEYFDGTTSTCTALTTCGTDEYVSTAETASSDRVCSQVT